MAHSKLISGLYVRVKRMGVTKKILRFFLESYRSAVIRAAGLIKGIDPDKVVFSCLNARTYGDNLKPISEALHELRPETEIVWMFRHPKDKKGIVPDYVRCVDPISVKGLAEYGTARVWADNFTLARYLKRRRGKQFYLNPWHGDRPFKKVAYDMFPDRRMRIEESSDLILAGSEFGERMIRSAFRYKGEILREGCPRNDCLVNPDPERARLIKEKIGVTGGEKLLLYAPTFRDSTRMQALETTLDFGRVLSALEKKTGGRWLCLYRAHQLQLGGVAVDDDPRMLNMTKYEDMADLLLVSDAILTDYSSAAADFSLLRRRVFLYQDDIDQYTSVDRELYFRMEDSPFLVAHDMDELEALIARVDDDEAARNCDEINRFFGTCETGHAAYSAARRIISWLDNGKT